MGILKGCRLIGMDKFVAGHLKNRYRGTERAFAG